MVWKFDGKGALPPVSPGSGDVATREVTLQGIGEDRHFSLPFGTPDFPIVGAVQDSTLLIHHHDVDRAGNAGPSTTTTVVVTDTVAPAAPGEVAVVFDSQYEVPDEPAPE